MKLQLDHKALLAVIEADKDFELEIRKGIMDSVLRKVMTPKDRVYDVVAVIKEVLDSLGKFDAEITKKNWEGRKVLSKEAHNLIDLTVKKHMRTMITSKISVEAELNAAIEEAIKHSLGEIDSMISKKMNKALSKHIDAQVESRLKLLQ